MPNKTDNNQDKFYRVIYLNIALIAVATTAFFTLVILYR